MMSLIVTQETVPFKSVPTMLQTFFSRSLLQTLTILTMPWSSNLSLTLSFFMWAPFSKNSSSLNASTSAAVKVQPFLKRSSPSASTRFSARVRPVNLLYTPSFLMYLKRPALPKSQCLPSKNFCTKKLIVPSSVTGSPGFIFLKISTKAALAVLIF